MLEPRPEIRTATRLGAFLDPLADKAMIVSIYVALGIADAIPRWLVILVVSRDIMIVSAVILSWLVDKPVALKPLAVSKFNTVAQILLALLVLAALGYGFDADLATGALVIEDIAEGAFEERALFHLINLVREEQASLLVTARTAPGGWSVAIRDLGSRLKALPVVALAAPDDMLLRAVLVKLF